MDDKCFFKENPKVIHIHDMDPLDKILNVDESILFRGFQVATCAQAPRMRH